MLDHLQPVAIIRPPDKTEEALYSEIAAARATEAQAAWNYRESRSKYAGFNPICADAFKHWKQAEAQTNKLCRQYVAFMARKS